MNFSDAFLTIELILQSKAVPLIIGESGIGKTSLVRRLCENKNYHLITIDANLLKEGEIGGLPTVQDYEVEINNLRKKRKKTVYAVHTKLLEIDEITEKDPNKNIILFIDEINRCEHSVQQELMNLILNREINGYNLPYNVEVIAAMNPSNKYEAYENTEYQVVDMDPAQEDRFVWLELDSDVKEWVQWGMSSRGNIHTHILEFISTFPQHLHTPDSREHIKATPRSWERISKAYKVYLGSKEKYDKSIFYNVVKGNVGVSIAQDFISFLESYKEFNIKAEDIFNSEVISEDLRDRLKGETHSRLYIIAKNYLMHLEEHNHEEKHLAIFSKLLMNYPKDLRLGIMREIKSDYDKTLYREFREEDNFIELFFSCYI